MHQRADEPQKDKRKDGKTEVSSNRVMTAYEVSRLLKVPLSTLYGLSKSGKIKAIKVGKHWRYLSEEIDQYLHSQERAFPSERKRFPFHAGSDPKRLCPRINCELQATLTVMLKRKDGRDQPGLIFNLSESGALFVSEVFQIDIEVGDPVKIEFAIRTPEGIDRKIELMGRIVRYVPGERPKIAVKFKYLPSASQEVLRAYVG